MATFNFNHTKGTIQSCMGLKTAEKIETTVVGWIKDGILKEDANECVTSIMERIQKHKSYTYDEKLFAMFILGSAIMTILERQKHRSSIEEEILGQLFDQMRN